MKKGILYLGVAAMAMTFAFSTTNYTYADDVQVNFRIANHKAEISIRSSSDKTEFSLGDKVPDTIITYKNAIRAVVRLVGPDGTILKTDDSTLDLANENKTKLIDFSEVELDTVGDYKITSSGFNVDGDETVGNEITLQVKEEAVEIPEVPDTGGVVGLIQDFMKNDLSILLLSVATITILGVAVKLAKGVRR